MTYWEYRVWEQEKHDGVYDNDEEEDSVEDEECEADDIMDKYRDDKGES